MIDRLFSTTRGELHGCTKQDAILSNGWIYCKAKHDCDALSTSTSKSITSITSKKSLRIWVPKFPSLDSRLYVWRDQQQIFTVGLSSLFAFLFLRSHGAGSAHYSCNGANQLEAGEATGRRLDKLGRAVGSNSLLRRSHAAPTQNSRGIVFPQCPGLSLRVGTLNA